MTEALGNMTQKQFNKELAVLGYQNWDKNRLSKVLDLLERGTPVNSIASNGKANKLHLGNISLDPKTVRKMRGHAIELRNLIMKFEGNIASDINEEHYTAYEEKGLIEGFELNRIRGGIASALDTRDDTEGEKRLHDMLDLEQAVPEEQWCVQYLESIGYQTNEALEILKEHDIIWLWRMNAETTHSKYEGDGKYEYLLAQGVNTPSAKPMTKTSEVKKLAMFISLNRYMKLFTDVIIQRTDNQPFYLVDTPKSANAVKKIPENYREVAHQLIAKGRYDDPLLVRTGWAIIRYAIWIDEKHREAFEESLRPWKRTKQEHERYMKNIYKMIEGSRTNGR